MKIDYAKRRRVMERSQALGHCICDVQRPCPCDVFEQQGICPCAGERPDPIDIADVKLTELVHNAGCASKIAPADLDTVLSRLPQVTDPAVICGVAAGDDAGIYRISDNLSLVQTVDVFTPCVDDPLLFGRICAANCLSDIYAMGGEPRTALSIMAFPSEKMSGEVMYRMLAGAMEVLDEAGVALIGGHSIKDEEIKLGFAITGTIDPDQATAVDNASIGDVLVLTKPLGTGVLTFAQQVGRGHPEGLAAAQASMAALNRGASEAMIEAGATACTDVTGFGLFGHLIRMLRQGRLAAEVYGDTLPAFAGALDALRQGVIPGVVERNKEYVGDDIQVSPDVDEAWVNLGFDAQTSGGLLIAIPAGRLDKLQRALTELGINGAVVGRITESSAGQIRLVRAAENQSISASNKPTDHQPTNEAMKPAASESHASHEGCCADVFSAQTSTSSVSNSQKAFGEMMRSVQSQGVLNEKTKELMTFSLVVLTRCGPCFDAHYRKACDMGITQAELDEAAWCAIAMGGAPVKMFYQEHLQAAQQGKTG